MKKLLIILAFLALLVYKSIGQIEVKQAEKVAETIVNDFNKATGLDHRINNFHFINYEDNLIAYAFTVEPVGFVIVSAVDNVFPVLAWSYDGNYKHDEHLNGFSLFMNKYKKEINYAINNSLPKTPEIQVAWDSFLTGNSLFFDKNNRAVSPLLTTKWNQNKFYNEMCPPDANGPDGRTYAGCVATAMGQVMFYHRWPQTGTGSYTYEHPTYGTISADFSSSFYNWDEMPNQLNFSNAQVAKLLHHIGVSVDMDYGPNGSGMWNHKAAYSFKTHFKYGPETRYLFRDSITLNWDSIIVTNLQAGRPMYYAGWEDDTYTMGHAFVCDGYETNDFYHFNWGWGGSFDGFFYTNQLNPAGANFNFCQEVIPDMYPDTLLYDYPYYCNGIKELNSLFGTITDGSGINKYSSGLVCEWWINPECGSSPVIVFDKFELTEQDTLFIFDGTPAQHILIDFYSGNKQPILSSNSNRTSHKSLTGNLLIRFVSNNEDNGFQLSYSTVYCSIDTITDVSATVVDGSGTCEYRNNTSCRWVIQPPDAEVFYVVFQDFDLYSLSTNHSVQFYKESISSGNFLYKFTDQDPPPSSFVVEASSLIVRFLTSSTGSGQGWSFSYTSATTSSKGVINDARVNLFPNPTNNNSILTLHNITGKINLSLFDISGRKIAEHKSFSNNSTIELSFNEVFNDISSGYYTLVINNHEQKLSIKLCVVN